MLKKEAMSLAQKSAAMPTEENYYNSQRPHFAAGNLSPVHFELSTGIESRHNHVSH
jgi:hypothetical protein